MQTRVIFTKLIVVSALAASLFECVVLILLTLLLQKIMVFWLVLLGLSACVFAIAGYQSLRAPRVPAFGYVATAYAGALWIYMQYVAPHVPEPFGYGF